MRFPASHAARAALCLSLLLTGCDALFGPGTDDSKNSFLAAARARKDAYDYNGAVSLLEKALEANPRLTRAHWELGLLHYQNTHDYAAAVYHLQKLLVLDPKWKQTDDAQRIITDAKLELAKQAPFGPNTPQGEKLFSGLTAQLHQLSAENDTLRKQLTTAQAGVQQVTLENQQLRDALARSAAATNPPPAQNLTVTDPPVTNPSRKSPTPEVKVAPPKPPDKTPAPPASTGGTYTVRRGDTAAAIARRYSITIRDLERLNPRVNPARIKPGDVLRVRQS